MGGSSVTCYTLRTSLVGRRGFSKDGKIRVKPSRLYCEDRGNYYGERQQHLDSGSEYEKAWQPGYPSPKVLTCFSGRFVGGSSVACYTLRTFLLDAEASRSVEEIRVNPSRLYCEDQGKIFYGERQHHLDSSSYQTWLPIGSEIVFSN